MDQRRPRDLRLVAALFFLSGYSSLVYQVVWMRQLSLFLGSDVYSAAVILSCFMGGLSLGSFLIALLIDRVERPLVWYGVFEIAIGVCAIVFTVGLQAFHPIYQAIYRHWFDAARWRYQLFRASVASAMLLVPTSLMGATLPLMVKRFVSHNRALGLFSGLFYGVNTAGALVGALSVSFLLLPAMGVRLTTIAAIAVNVVVGATTLSIGARRGTIPQSRPIRTDAAESALPRKRFNDAMVGLIAIGISGLGALALEIVWTRVLVQSFSATVYSFSIMLCCFLFGIFYGSERASAVIDAAGSPLRVLGLLELALGVSVGLVGILSQVVPALFGRLLSTLTALTHGAFGASSVVAEFIVSTIIIAAPTILLGATFPAAVRACTGDADQGAESTGRVYAVNTLGGIVGAVLAAMVLIPAFGSRNSLGIIALIFVFNALWVLSRAGGPAALRRLDVTLPLGCCALFVITTFALPRQIVMNFNQQRSSRPDAIYHGEGVAHTIDIVRNARNDVIMMVDGNVEADTSYLQRRHFILKAHLPLLLHPRPASVAIVGLGLGITLKSTTRHPGVDAIEVIELTPEMLDAHTHLEAITGSVMRDPRIRVRIDDGTNFMRLTDQTFDMITSDPIHPRISGVGYLYTTEYYESVKRRLRPDGVVCQWMPMYQISRTSFEAAFRSFATVFPNVSFWYVRGHGLLVATQAAFRIDYARLAARLRDPLVKQDLDSIQIDSPCRLLAHMLMGPRQVARYLSGSGRPLLNTNDNGYLEYHTPFELLSPMKEILSSLMPFAGLDTDAITDIPERERRELGRLWDARRAAILPEIEANDVGAP